MSNNVGEHSIFESWAGRSHPWGPEDRWSVSFGGGVLETVISRLDEFLSPDDWRSPYWISSAVLGCTPRMTDEAVVDRLLQVGSSCVVINKPDGFPGRLQRLPDAQAARLHRDGRGFPLDALTEFAWLAPRVDGGPAVLGPYSGMPLEGMRFESLRVAGVSKQSNSTVPLVHAKLLLLGAICYSDEGPGGHLGDFYTFEPRQVWLGSSNLTRNARRNLEFGIWTDDPSLLAHTKKYLSNLLTYTEPFDSYRAHPEPELVPYEFDEEAMAEAAADMRGEDEYE